MSDKLYNHAYEIAFSIYSDNLPSKVTAQEIVAGLRARLAEFNRDPEYIHECVGLPFDSYALDGSEMPDEEPDPQE
jgi:hypothetical protein